MTVEPKATMTTPAPTSSQMEIPEPLFSLWLLTDVEDEEETEFEEEGAELCTLATVWAVMLAWALPTMYLPGVPVLFLSMMV